MAPDNLALSSPAAASEVPPAPLAPWRHWAAFLVLALFPLAPTLLPLISGGSPSINWPRDVPGLLWFCATKLAFFGAYYGLAWAFTRSSRDELFLHWRGSWKTPFLALFLSFGARAAALGVEALAVIFIAAVVTRLGVKPTTIAAAIKAHSDGADQVFRPVLMHGTLIYRILMISLISFVLAGVREEFWRGAAMNSLGRIAPRGWSERRKNLLALGVSSALFGMGHLYQGWGGVLGTSVVGLFFGLVMLPRRSVWPAVIAHGCFDATSFLLLLNGS